jgi:hypothetical protein
LAIKKRKRLNRQENLIQNATKIASTKGMTTDGMMDKVKKTGRLARIASELEISLSDTSIEGMNKEPTRRIRQFRKEWLPEDPSAPPPDYKETLVSSRVSICDLTD